MLISLRGVKIFRSHVVPLVLAFRLVNLSTPDSLAVAATYLPELSQPMPITDTLADQNHRLDLDNFLYETNRARSEHNVSTLRLSAKLNQAAQAKLDDMLIHNYWDHFRPADHKAPWDFIQAAGYHYHFAGENLARGFETPYGITAAWLASPAHRANLLSDRYDDVGFASKSVLDEHGQAVLITVQLFAAQ